MPIQRRKTRQVHIGNVAIGGGAPISVQSMTSTPTADVKRTVREILRLQQAGCEIVRLGIPDMASALAVAEIKKLVKLPLVADIHFDPRLALESVRSGVDALRINPGNIRDPEAVKSIVQACKERKIPIRVGVNGGSIDRAKYPRPTAQALVDSAFSHIRILEEQDFHDIKVSLKSSDVADMVEAYRLFSKQSDYPLHLGVTEAGGYEQAVIKSSIGMGALLLDGIGDTLRVSITGDVVKEVEAAKTILRVLGLKKQGIEIISCPTCARKEFDVEKTVNQLTDRTRHISVYMKVAVMGCVVNGPGEAMDADIGVAVGKKDAVLFRKGKIVRNIRKSEILPVLVREIHEISK
jgi:(E)-4-hydroxy-3-methylbut-2-enyl-diphosphate synthase